ncbi:MAG TPA: hypothetical protein VNC15_11120, partial [Solirubrobacterales bacterium]|nr:hypothetical protein [Solirubrobacterales bacterium]
MRPITTPKINRVRVGLDDLLATSVHSCVVVAWLSAGGVGCVIEVAPGWLVLDDLGDRAAVDPDDGARGELYVDHLVLDVDDS